MRHRSIFQSVVVVVALLAFVSVTFAQARQQSGAPKVSNWGYQAEGPRPELPPLDPNEAFDPHDFSGVWLTNHRSTDGFRSMTEESEIPPRTARAQEIFLSRLTGRGQETVSVRHDSRDLSGRAALGVQEYTAQR